jgi:hypothetical protein
MSYYKLSLLRKTESGAQWEKFYIKFEDNNATILDKEAHSSLLNSRLEKISEEDAKKAINDSNVDLSYG